jgi:hypothetical protein
MRLTNHAEYGRESAAGQPGARIKAIGAAKTHKKSTPKRCIHVVF